MIAATLRLANAVHAGAVLVARPRGVVHVHTGPLTRSGRHAAARPLCGAVTRRLAVVGRASSDLPAAVEAAGRRRFCRTCLRMLPARLGSTQQLVTRDDWIEMFADLTVADLHLAARWARTVDETYQVMRLLGCLHGPKPPRGPLADAYDQVTKRRHKLTLAAMTDDERAAVHAARDTEAFNRRLAERTRRCDIAVERAQDRARRGRFLTPHERELLDTA